LWDRELREIFGGPVYLGVVTGVKQEYHVLRTARGDYAVFSKSNRGGSSFHMTFVRASKVEFVTRLIPESGTTARSVAAERSLSKEFETDDEDSLYFEVLTTLYVIAALGAVEVRRSGRSLLFVPVGDAPDRRGGRSAESGL
jgi:hypothetical protein